MRERNGEHTCDKLRPHQRQFIASRYPGWNVEEATDEEDDSSWHPDIRETFEEQQ